MQTCHTKSWSLYTQKTNKEQKAHLMSSLKALDSCQWPADDAPCLKQHNAAQLPNSPLSNAATRLPDQQLSSCLLTQTPGQAQMSIQTWDAFWEELNSPGGCSPLITKMHHCRSNSHPHFARRSHGQPQQIVLYVPAIACHRCSAGRRRQHSPGKGWQE